MDDNISSMMIEGSLKRTRFIFRSEKRKEEILHMYRRKAERDYEEMAELRTALNKGKEPRKKHRNSDCFVDTKLPYRFPLGGMTKDEAIEHAVKHMISGKEGLFVLVTNRELTASEVLGIYRSRNVAESAFRDLKHGIDWRPARCTSPDAVKGRILISFLALFCLSLVRFLHPGYETRTAESLSEELGSFALTVIPEKNGLMKRIWSNFTPPIRLLGCKKRSIQVQKAPGQVSLEAFG